jgi:hypothetical protein
MVIFALCIGLLTGSMAVAQTPNQANSQTKSRHKTKVDVRYDKKRDLSRVMLEEIVLWTNPVFFEQVSMDVSFEFPTRRIVTPKSVSLVFRSVTKDRVAFRDDSLVAAIDGSQLDLGVIQRPGNRDLRSKSGIYFDLVRQSISYDEFVQIAQAKKLELTVGGISYDVSKDQIQFLSDFLQLMQQKGEEFK